MKVENSTRNHRGVCSPGIATCFDCCNFLAGFYSETVWVGLRDLLFILFVLLFARAENSVWCIKFGNHLVVEELFLLLGCTVLM
jgi:hypothetical protein